jgi:hypothetical protein
MNIILEKHLRELYAYAIDWCTQHSVPPSWIRVWGADEFVYNNARRDAHFCKMGGAAYNGYVWMSPAELSEPAPRLGFRGDVDSRARAWLTIPTIDELRVQGLSSYEPMLSPMDSSKETPVRLLLAAINIRHEHQWISKRQSVRPDPQTMQCVVCLVSWEKWMRRVDDKAKRPCSFWIEPLLGEQSSAHKKSIVFCTHPQEPG